MKTNLVKVALMAAAFVVGFSSCDDDDPTYTVTLAVNPSNAGTVTGGGDYKKGDIIQLTATANENFYFVSWTEGTNELSTEATFDYTVGDKDVTLTANFNEKKIVTLGAQSNTTFPGFLSVSEGATYNFNEASSHQAAVDIFCFYEVGNDIALASPGSNITGIFGGTETDPANWTTKNTTLFNQVTTLTVAQFDTIPNGDANIQTYYSADAARQKAKLLIKDNIYAFKTQNGTYGLLKVIDVSVGADGFIKFEYKTK